MKNDFLTVQEAANLVGVSSSTFKLMCESESIPLYRTPGGHRRIDRMELDRIKRKHPGGYSPLQSTESRDGHRMTESILNDLLADRSFEVAKRLSQAANTTQDLIAIIEDCLVAAVWKVGELWREKEIDIFQEHVCTSAAQTAIDILRQSRRPAQSNGMVAIGGAFAPSIETLPSRLISVCLNLTGVNTIDLGCFLPAESIAMAAHQYKADLVWITHTHIQDIDSLLNSHHVLRDALPEHTTVIVGGGGLSPAVRRSIPWCKYYETISQMTDEIHASVGPGLGARQAAS